MMYHPITEDIVAWGAMPDPSIEPPREVIEYLVRQSGYGTETVRIRAQQLNPIVDLENDLITLTHRHDAEPETQRASQSMFGQLYPDLRNAVITTEEGYTPEFTFFFCGETRMTIHTPTNTFIGARGHAKAKQMIINFTGATQSLDDWKHLYVNPGMLRWEEPHMAWFNHATGQLGYEFNHLLRATGEPV